MSLFGGIGKVFKSTFKRAKRAVSPVLRTGAIGAATAFGGPVGGQLATGFLGGAASAGRLGRLPRIGRPPGGARRPGGGGGLVEFGLGLLGGGAAGAVGDGPTQGSTLPVNGACPQGFHFEKGGLGYCVRNRRMNVQNSRAFMRSYRRVRGAKKFARKVDKLFPRQRRVTHHHPHHHK